MAGSFIKWLFPGRVSPTALASSLKRALSDVLHYLSIMVPQIPVRPLDHPPDNIAMFRTITTVLSYIPRAHKIETTDNLKQGLVRGAKAYAVKIMDAFTQLANTDRDVVAAAANDTFKENIDITACIESSGSDNNANTSSGVLSQLLSYLFVFARNDKILDPTSHSATANPTLTDAEAPADLGNRRAMDYIVDLQSNWRKPTFSSHMWLLANAVSDSCNNTFTANAPDRPSVLRHLFRYVAASCHAKILSRMADKRISRPFLLALNNIDAQTVPLPFQSSSRRAPFHYRPAAPTSDEIYNDHQFLHHFIQQAKEHSLLGTLKIPHLSRMAYLPVAPDRIYNNDTCKEVHQVLVFILNELESVLQRIQILTNAPSASNSEEFKKKLHAAQMYAYALLRLVRGHALKMHLYNISTLLDTHLPAGQRESARVPRTDDSEEYDEDLEAIEPGDHTGWLRLALAHFEAIEIIISFLTDRALVEKSPTSITVRILASPLASGKMYPWRKLFVDPVLFPAEAQDVYSNAAMIDNIGLRDWLELTAADATRLEALFGLASSASQKWTSPFSQRFSHYESIHDSISALAADGDLPLTESESIDLDKTPCNLRVLNKTARDLRVLLEEWYMCCKVERDISDGLRLLKRHLCLPSGSSYPGNKRNKKKQVPPKGVKETQTDAKKSEALSKLVNSASSKWADPSRRLSNYESILHSVTKLAADGGLPTIKLDSDSEAEDIDLNQTAHNLAVLLKTWLTACQQKSQLEMNISDGLEVLECELRPPSAYTYLANLSKLDKETMFTGATHCEACLATFLDDTQGGTNSKYANHLVTPPLNTILQALKDYKRVIGVSKRCCPVCARFLFELSNWAGGEPFSAHGSHPTITPCTLPLWTPSVVVDAMIQYFGTMLRHDLLKLRKHLEESNNRNYSRTRSQSSASARLSPCGPIKHVSQY